VLNTVKAFVLNTGSIAAVTGTLSGTTFTVKQVLTLTATTSNAVNTFTGQALPIASGDMIAYWSTSAGPALYRSGTGASGSSYRAAATSLPTVGQSFTVSSLTNLLMLQATGS
jgi:hypothetical protein